MVFQDSYASLNPRLTMEEAIAFGPTVNGMPAGRATSLAHQLLSKVGLEPKRFAGRYPHELSGGQRQRVNIARALAFEPKIVILDEAVSALDKSVEAQVLNLLVDLKRELGLTYVFISHDLNVVRYMSDRVMVMYLGEVAEIGPVDAIYASPSHPYTRALLSAMPSMDPDRRTREAPLAGDPPNPINPPPRLPFPYPLQACGRGVLLGIAGSLRARRAPPPRRLPYGDPWIGPSGRARRRGSSRMSTPLVEIADLRVRFHGARTVHAVNGVDLTLAAGETLSILGESGSGKSVTLKTLLRLLPENRTEVSGAVRVAGQDVLALSGEALAAHRGGVASMIFQDPMLALDPVYTIGDQIAEAVVRHERVSQAAGMERALEMLTRVRIPSPERRLKAYPHEMSGGMRQRAMIALALACRPKLLLADEPTTALDATVQIQILLLLKELQREFGMGMIFVTHDIGVAVEVSDRIAVMYAGEFVETGSVREIMREPRHPYTKGLLAANLHGAIKGARLDAIPGAPPPLDSPPAACSFAPRCAVSIDGCATSRPPAAVLGPGRMARCVHAAAAPAHA